MKKHILLSFLLCGGILLAISPVKADDVTALAEGQPEDVGALITQENECNHWSGEEPYDAARGEEIEAAMKKLKCDDIDTTETALRKKYANAPATLKALDDVRNYFQEQ